MEASHDERAAALMSAIDADEIRAWCSTVAHGSELMHTITSAPAIGAPVSSTTREPNVIDVRRGEVGAAGTSAYGYVVSTLGQTFPQHSARPSLRTPQIISFRPDSCENAPVGGGRSLELRVR